MKIMDLQVMRGPNYWSPSHNHIILLKIGLEETEREPTHQLDGFADRLRKLMPSLQSHRCSAGHEGGFFEVVERGTWMGHVAEHIAIELQCLAGMDVAFGKTLSTPGAGMYHVMFEYKDEDAGKFAARAALKICDALVKNTAYDLQPDVDELRRIAKGGQLGPSTSAIITEAASRGIPIKRLDGDSLFVLGYGNRQKKIRATVAGTTYGIGIEIARDKEETKRLLFSAHIPVPAGVLLYDENDLESALDEIPFPVVIKPLNANHGRGITTNVKNKEQALEAFASAATISRPVILEEFLEGTDFRIVVINYKFVAAACRTPATVTGDGTSSITQLVEKINADPRRGKGHESTLTRIEIDDATLGMLEREGLTPDSILPEGKQVVLKHTANISTGGTAEDVTDLVHPYNVFLAERIARIVGLDICGIDILAKDLSRPLDKNNGAVVEVNAGPGLRMHLEPEKGLPRNIARPIIDMFFPDKDRGRIPLVAITGTNGKTTTTRLTAHLMQHAGGHKVGFTTTDGIYINGHMVYRGDCTGPKSSEVVLFDPTIDFAVLETARGGLLRSGLAFNECDISVVTNVSADHLGLKEIHTLEEMAKVKAVVPGTTAEEGYAILNADDDLVYDMRNDLDCHIALFSTDAQNERIVRHCQDGGLAAVIEEGYLTIIRGSWKTRIDKIDRIPLTLNGRAESMIRNIMPAALVAWISKIDKENIRKALRTFAPSPEQTPGRMNIFDFGGFEVMVDYAHNLDGMEQLGKFIERTKAPKNIGIIGIAGDRRDEDIRAFGKLSALVFDEIIIRHDTDMRGRDKDEMTALLMEGITSSGKKKNVKLISPESAALQYAMDNAEQGTFITICSEQVSDTLKFVAEQQQLRKKTPQKNQEGAVPAST